MTTSSLLSLPLDVLNEIAKWIRDKRTLMSFLSASKSLISIRDRPWIRTRHKRLTALRCTVQKLRMLSFMACSDGMNALRVYLENYNCQRDIAIARYSWRSFNMYPKHVYQVALNVQSEFRIIRNLDVITCIECIPIEHKSKRYNAINDETNAKVKEQYEGSPCELLIGHNFCIDLRKGKNILTVVLIAASFEDVKVRSRVPCTLLITVALVTDEPRHYLACIARTLGFHVTKSNVVTFGHITNTPLNFIERSYTSSEIRQDIEQNALTH